MGFAYTSADIQQNKPRTVDVDRQQIATELGYSETIFIDLPEQGSTTAHARIFTPVRARNTLLRSHLACTTLSAPCDLMVSMPVRLSISVALRIALAWRP